MPPKRERSPAPDLETNTAPDAIDSDVPQREPAPTGPDAIPTPEREVEEKPGAID